MRSRSQAEKRIDKGALIGVVLLALPWLGAWPYGPSPSVLQGLITGALAAVWWLTRSMLQAYSSPMAQHVPMGWLVAATLSALMGLLQYFQLTESFGGLVHAADPGQAYANLRQRNQLATLLAVGLLSAILVKSQPFASRRWRSAPIESAVVLLGAADAASGSRTGLIQLLAVGCMCWVWKRGQALWVIFVSVYAAAAWLLPHWAGLDPLVSGILGRVGESVPSCSSRLTLWSNVLHLIAQKPWLGWGWGNLDYAHFITLYPGERFCDILDNAHNLPLHLAVELGVPVAVAFCALCGWLVWRNKPWAETDPTRQMAWGVLAVIGLHSMLEYPLWYGPFQLATALCIWMLWRSPGQVVNNEEKRPLARMCQAQAATVLIAICGYTAWDYWRISQIYLPPSARNAAYRDDTLSKIQGSWLFRDQVRFAELTTTTLTPDNAAHVNALAKDMLHFSPESRVVEKVIESAVMLDDDAQALFYLERFKAAFPAQHARWSAKLKTPPLSN